MSEAPKKPMNIEQAGNYLKEKAKTSSEDIKKEAAKQQISVAPPEDKKKFLMYCINRVDNKQLKALLTVRVIHGWSYKRIAQYFNVSVDQVKALEKVAIEAVKEAITITRNTNIPIIGGLS
jgi:DNA-directed RNA polymerase specialized sigma24 family protein